MQSDKSFTRFILVLGAALALTVGSIGCRKDSGVPGEAVPPPAARRVPTIGVANYGAHPAIDVVVEGFKKRLTERGYRDGDDVKILWKSVEGDINLASSVAQSLVGANVDVIVSITTPISQSVYKVAKGKVPIVFCGVTDPISAGLVASWDNKPGSGITGTSDRWPYSAHLDLIKTLVPNVKKIGLPRTVLRRRKRERRRASRDQAHVTATGSRHRGQSNGTGDHEHRNEFHYRASARYS